MLYEKKKQSLLSWVQSAGGHDVTSFSQLCDGKLLNELVVTLSDKDCNLSSKAEIEPEETDSSKVSETSVGEKEQCELTKETVDPPCKKIEGQEQEVINGYHDPSTNELSGIISHSDINKTEDENGVSENGVHTESNDSVSVKEMIIDSQKTEDDTTDVDKKCTSMDLTDACVNGSLRMDGSVSHEHSNTVKNIDDRDFNIPAESAASEIEGRYVVVQKFIESMLELKCMALVNFSQCLEGHELELAKLTVLLLSAMVQYSLSTNKSHVMASCYSLAPDAQEEIMDCLELFLKERQSPIERKEFEVKLSRRAKLRISPRKHSNPLSTPQLKPARRGRKRKAYNNMEEFLDKGFESPIQNLIQSPDIRHITPNSEARLLEAVRCKDKTIALLTYDLDVEKYNVDDLKKQNEDLSSQLLKLRKENKKLKEELDEVQTNLENNELSFEKAQKDWKNEVKGYQSQIKDLKDAEMFWKESCQVENSPTNQKLGCTCSEEISSLKCALQAKDDKIKESQKQIEILTVQLEKLCKEKDDLKSRLEENLSSDNKTTLGRSSTQEKCFNISDLSLRNELKDKCEELQYHLKQKEIDYSDKIQKLEELLLQKDKVEKEYRTRLRKTDKEREDAINNQKKLEIENSNLKGQVEVFKNVLPDVSSPLLPKSSTGPNSSSANRRSSRHRNACDSEKIGQLWHNYEGEMDDAVNSNTIQIGIEPDKPCSESSTVLPLESENKSLNQNVTEKSQNKLWRSQSASNITSNKDSVTACTLCSQNDFYDVPPLIQNICKIVREDNILDTNVLLELHKYERDFDMNDLVKMLTLLTRILLEGTSNRNCSKHIREFSSHDLNSDISLEQVNMSKTNQSEQPRKKNSIVNTDTGESSQCPELDSVSSESHGTLEKNSSIKLRQLLKGEKKKVACLQSKLKNLKNLQSLDKEKLQELKTQLARSAQLQKENVRRCRNFLTKNELLKKEIRELKEEMEKMPEPVIKHVIKTLPPPPCDKCPRLNEEIMSFQIAKRDWESLTVSLKNDLQVQKAKNEDLKRELYRLNKKKDELEEKLSDPRIISAGVYSPALKSLREKFKESLYKDVGNVSDDSQEMQCHNVLAVTNYSSTTVPSVSGFVGNNRNQSQLRAFCKAEDEADMLSQSSIFERQSDTPNKRLDEINRRNTLCLPHLKSQYPLELNTTPSQHKYFQPPATPSCSNNMSTIDMASVHLAKKRKISKSSSVRSSFASLMSSSRPSTSGSGIRHSSTPKVKTFKNMMCKTDTGAVRVHFRRSKDSMGK